MDKLIIDGPVRLSGTVNIAGSKNAALPIMAACLLTEGKSLIKGVPELSDVFTMCKILRALGVKINFSNHFLEIDSSGYKGSSAAYKYVSTMRASICVLGPLLARKKAAKVSLPGGCIIGPRPINIHIKGLKALGADITIEHGYIMAQTKGLKGGLVYLGGTFGSSVLATCNVMMAACLAKGKTTIEYAACEPEVVDLAEFLIKMGAKIKGHKTHTIEIEGQKALHGACHTIIPDRIEAGTFMIGAAITQGNITIDACLPEHLSSLVEKLRQAGAEIDAGDHRMTIRGPDRIQSVDIKTMPYPGFPTDLQAQFMTLMAVADGWSMIRETIFENRFIHVSELRRMGADIEINGSQALVKGKKRLFSAPVMATDLRASASLVLAGLVAEGGKTEVHRIYHLDRGYEAIEEKFRGLGAAIWRESE